MTNRLPHARWLARRVALVAAFGLAGGLIGLLAWIGAENSHAGLVAVMAVIAPLPLVVRGLQGRFDPFEPINFVVIAVAVMFVWRPVVELQKDLNPFPGFDARQGFDHAMVIAIVGTGSLYLAYFSSAGRKLAGRLRPLPDHWDIGRSVRFATGLLVVGALLTLMLVAVGGLDPLVSKFTGRSGLFRQNTTAASSGYLIQGPYLVIPAALILLVAYQRERNGIVGVLLGVCVLVALLLTIPSGGRHFSLQFGLPIIVLWYLRRQRRPRVASIVIAIVAFLMFANISGSLRNTANRHGTSVPAAVTEAVTDPGAQLDRFISGPDPSEFTVLEIQAQAYGTGRLEHRPGSTAMMLALGGVPRQAFGGDKPWTPMQYVSWTLFPETLYGAGFTSSTFGAMYADAGWVSLVLLSVLFGVGLRGAWQYFLSGAASSGMQLAFAVLLPMLVIVMRNELLDLFYRSVFMIGPIFACIWLASGKPRLLNTARTQRRVVRARAPAPTR